MLTHVISFDSLSEVLAHCVHETKIIELHRKILSHYSLFIGIAFVQLVNYFDSKKYFKGLASKIQTDKGQGSKSTNHRRYTDFSLTIVFSKRSGLLH